MQEFNKVSLMQMGAAIDSATGVLGYDQTWNAIDFDPKTKTLTIVDADTVLDISIENTDLFKIWLDAVREALNG